MMGFLERGGLDLSSTGALTVLLFSINLIISLMCSWSHHKHLNFQASEADKKIRVKHFLSFFSAINLLHVVQIQA